MDDRTISEEYAKIGFELIGDEEVLSDLYNSTVSIAFLSSTQKKISHDKKIFAQCEKVPQKYKWKIPYDFTITVFEPNIEGFTEDQIRILIFHELLHIKIIFNSDGTETGMLRSHDLEDFKYIIDRFGTDWNFVKDTKTGEIIRPQESETAAELNEVE